MKLLYLSRRPLAVFSLFCLLIFSHSVASAQAKETAREPLTLAQVKALLQVKNGKTQNEKNLNLVGLISNVGLSFGLTLDSEKELRALGADDTLVKTIRMSNLLEKIAKPEKITNPTFKPGYIWTENNVTHNGQKGMNIYAMFTAKNLKDTPCTIMHTFKTDPSSDYGEISVKGISNKYKALNSDLRPKTNFTPKTQSTVYSKLTTFVPYSEFNLTKPKLYTLQLSSKIVTMNGKTSGQFNPQRIYTLLPKDPSKKETADTNKPKVVIDKVWTKYDITEKGKLGMRVHVKFSAYNLKGKPILLQTFFSNRNGPLKAKTDLFSTKAGQTSLNRKFTPRFDESEYEDVPMFIPYEEFGLGNKVDLITMETTVTTSKESTPLCKPKKTEFIHNLKLDFK